MKLELRKYEIVIIRSLLNGRMNSLDRQGVAANQYRKLSLLDKRIKRQEEYVLYKKEKERRRKKKDGLRQEA